MALKSIFRTNQSAYLGGYFLNILSSMSNFNSSAVGSFSLSSLYYTVPSGKKAKVIVNNFYLIISNVMGGFYSSSTGTSGSITGSLILTNSFQQKVLMNIGSGYSYSFSSSASVSTNSFLMMSSAANLVATSRSPAISIPNYGMNYNILEYYAEPFDASYMRGKLHSYYNHPFSGLYFLGTEAATGGTLLGNIKGVNTLNDTNAFLGGNDNGLDEMMYPRIITLSAGQSINLDVSLSFLLSYSQSSALSAIAVNSLNLPRYSIDYIARVELDFLVLEDSI